jgi:coproporphyrinogen III oxidase
MDIEIKKDLVSNWFKTLQNSICCKITEIENKNIKFQSKVWKKNNKIDEGGGEYRILRDGKIFEKGNKRKY